MSNEAKLNVKLLRWTPNPEELVAISAKLCYSPSDIQALIEKQTPEAIERFVNMLVDIGHESPTEHVSFTFAVEGVSRVLTHQLVRHRIASYSQQSQRYVKESQFDYVIPDPIKRNSAARNRFILAMKQDQEHYDFISYILKESFLKEWIKEWGFWDEYTRWEKSTSYYKDKAEHFLKAQLEDKKLSDNTKNDIKAALKNAEKKAIENARYVFPNACETKIILTMNARSLKHFFSERCCKRAQDEIRALANAMLKECKEKAPVLFKDAGPKCLKQKMCPEGHMSCKAFPTVDKVLKYYEAFKDEKLY